MNNVVFAYIDESGNTDLDTNKNGVSKYFVISAIITTSEKREKLLRDVEVIRARYFQTGEIKSSSVGNKKNRRAKILAAICKLDFKFYALAVDKKRINKDSGYQYKQSFLKNINDKLYSVLLSSYSEIHIIADEHGNEKFKESFIKYINNKHKYELFYQSSLTLKDSKDEVLVQLSDFIVGTVAKAYEKNTSPELKEAYIELIKTKALSIDDWPPKYQLALPKDKTTDEYSQLIYTYSLMQAEIFIEKHQNTADEDMRLQVSALRFMLFNSSFIDKNKYITTKEILQYLSESGYEITTHVLRSKIIAPLRDSNVVISSSNKGYKIPCCFKDMEEFVEMVNSMIKPLISRLGRAHKNLNTASNGELNILKGPNYPHLIDFIEILEKYRKAEI